MGPALSGFEVGETKGSYCSVGPKAPASAARPRRSPPRTRWGAGGELTAMAGQSTMHVTSQTEEPDQVWAGSGHIVEEHLVGHRWSRPVQRPVADHDDLEDCRWGGLYPSVGPAEIGGRSVNREANMSAGAAKMWSADTPAARKASRRSGPVVTAAKASPAPFAAR